MSSRSSLSNLMHYAAFLLIMARHATVAIKTPSSTCNHLLNISQLRNDYYVLRHGQSKANVDKVISSNPAVATVQHGLSEVGRKQASIAAASLVDTYHAGKEGQPYKGIIILSSDFLRAKETANSVLTSFLTNNIQVNCMISGEKELGNQVIIERRLRERWFGNFDGGSDDHYKDVWKDDALDPSHTKEEVESVNSVMNRTTKCILEWDDKVSNYLVILVAHGDVLQICQTAFAKMDGSKHRTVAHLETATPRQLNLMT